MVDAVGYGDSGSNFKGEGNPAPEISIGDEIATIGRYPDGTDTDDNGVDYVVTWWPTPGEPNTPAEPNGYTRVAGSVDGDDAYPAIIPDDDFSGLTLTIELPHWAAGFVLDMHCGVKISHTYIGDLTVELQSPDATSVVLHDGTGSGGDSIMTVYDLQTIPDSGSMDDFASEEYFQNDIWTLTIIDDAAYDTGEIEDWVLWFLYD